MGVDKEKTLQFKEFFKENFPKAKAFARKILKSEDDAEDVAQDIFVKLWDRPDLWIDRDKWESYLFSMLKNHIYNILSHRSVELHYLEDEAEKIRLSSLNIEEDTADKLYAKEISLLLKMAVEQMPEQRRKVFLLSRYKGLTNREIADKLQLSVRTVERHLYLALQDLKKIILFLFFLCLR